MNNLTQQRHNNTTKCNWRITAWNRFIVWFFYCYL